LQPRKGEKPMKKYLFLLSLLVIFFAASSSGGERILSTPAERLVGHWSIAGDNLYYGKLKSDGLGSYIIVHPNGSTYVFPYRIISQIPAEERVTVQLILSSGETRNDTCVISKDGKKLESTTELVGMKITTQLKYVDDKEKP
jgi:hypothetical protein